MIRRSLRWPFAVSAIQLGKLVVIIGVFIVVSTVAVFDQWGVLGGALLGATGLAMFVICLLILRKRRERPRRRH